jgi:hypothetical protein
MNLIDEQILHRQFGAGKITEQTKTDITVQFSKEYGCKKFIYPSAFESFLKLSDSDSKDKMDKELKRIRKKALEEQQKRAEEAQRLREEEHLAELEQKRALARRRAAAKKAAAKAKK